MIVDETKQCVSLFNLDLNRSKLGLKLAVCRIRVGGFKVCLSRFISHYRFSDPLMAI